MAIQAADIADLTLLTLTKYGRMKFTDVMSDYQNTIAVKRLMKKGKMGWDVNTGKSFTFFLKTSVGDNARFVGLYEPDVIDVPADMTSGEVPWRHVTNNWSFDHREVSMNSGAEKLVDLIQTRRIGAMGDWVQLAERRCWRVPASTDTVNPYGVPYWIVKSNTAVTTNDGFNGGVPSGYSTVAGIDPTASTISPRWNNYAAQYATVSKDDLVRKMERASDYTDFAPLVDDVPTYNTGDDYGYYTTYGVRQSLKEILESSNESLGMDLDPYHNKLVYRRSPVVWVKELDNDTTNPVYGINWGVFKTIGLRGWWLKEQQEPSHAGQHTVCVTFIDSSFNWVCVDRRRNFVLATTTGLPA